jgi:S-adenosylmethionine decarboxylase
VNDNDFVHRESNDYIGTHILADFWGCRFNDGAETLMALLVNAAHASDARVIGTLVKQFDPQGATALVLLAESHISAHTWPEYDYIAFDIFTCGKSMNPQLAVEYLEKRFRPLRVEIKNIHRGVAPDA